jgi:dCTP diphosphatase
MAATTIHQLQDAVRAFTIERDWEQFHNPKNLVMALTAEVGELVELFQWLSPEQADLIMDDTISAARVREELADVLIYVLRLADIVGIDLSEAVEAKLVLNAQKYPSNKVRGSALKYSDYEESDEGRS